jgi:hypothetical protein
MHKINSVYNKCFKYYIGNTKFVLYKKCVDFAYFTMHIISYNCTINVKILKMNANRTNRSKVINRAIHILFHGRVNKLLTYYCLNDLVPIYNKDQNYP